MKLSKSDVGKVLAVEFAFYAHTAITPELIKAWHLHFRNCETREFVAAMHLAVSENKTNFPPSPSDVKRMIKRLNAGPEQLETVSEAWDAVRKGQDISARARATLEMWPDWKQRDNWLTEHLPFKKRDFEKIYLELKDRDETLELQGTARLELGYGRDALTDAASDIMRELGW